MVKRGLYTLAWLSALQANNKTVRITTNADPSGETITITTSVTDAAGNPLAASVDKPL